MDIGIPRETKNHEYRVAVTPAGVRELVADGHTVLVETEAGTGSGFSDDEYRMSGATIVGAAADAWAAALVLKVKEPVPSEFGFMRDDLLLFTYLHLAADPECTAALLGSKTTSIAYETVQTPNGGLPLLAPMSEVAGRMSVQVGANLLDRTKGGTGVLMSGVPGVGAAKVVVLGGGVAGMSAAAIAIGMQADVTVIDRDVDKLRAASARFGAGIRTRASNSSVIEEACREADLVIGSVLIPGAAAPKLVPSGLVASMRPGSVLVDIAIDQGGCFEDSVATTHDDPTYRVAQSTFYCVANMPGAYPRTSTIALTNLTLPYARALAANGWQEASRRDGSLFRGLSTHGGALVNQEVARSLGVDFVDPRTLIAQPA